MDEDISFDDLVNSGSKKKPTDSSTSAAQDVKTGINSRWAMAITQPRISPSPTRKRPLIPLVDHTTNVTDASNASGMKEMKSWTMETSSYSGSGSLERIGHAIAMIGDKIYVHGGETTSLTNVNTLGETLVYTYTICNDDNNQKILKISSREVVPEGPSRSWHSSNVLHNGLLLIWGGEVVSKSSPSKEEDKTDITKDQIEKTIYLDEPMLLDPTINMWYPPTISGTGPGPRSGHTSAVIRGDLLVYICGRKGGTYCTSIFYLDSTRMHWMRPLIDGKPPRGRVYHTSSTVGDDTIVSFGGSDCYRCFNDVYCLQCNQKASGWKWFQPEIQGDIPPPRTGHVAVVIKNRYLLIFNGYNPYYYDDEDASNSDGVVDNDNDDVDRKAIFYPDFYVLDCKEWRWSKYIPSVCSVTKVDDRCDNQLKIQRSQEEHHHSQSLMPLAFSSAILLTDDSDANDMYDILIFGGLDNKGQHSNCMYLLNIHFNM